MYTNVYTWRYAVDRGPSEPDVFLSLTATRMYTHTHHETKQVLEDVAAVFRKTGLSLHAEMDNLKAVFLLLSGDR